MNSNEQFTTGVANLVRDVILTQISDGLRNVRGIVLSVDELLQLLDLPVSAPRTLTSPIHPAPLPPAPRASRSKKVTPVINGETCSYIFTRGANKDKRCTDPPLEGQKFCKNCISKRSGGAKVIAEIKSAPVITETVKHQLNVIETSTPGFYTEVANNFCLKKVGDNQYIVVGVFEGPNTVFKLTESEHAKAKELGIEVNDSKAISRPNVTLPTLPIPQLPL